MELFLGIDPGKSGAFALIDSDMRPILTENFSNFFRFNEVLNIYKSDIKFCAIELVFIISLTRANSATTFMKNAGGMEALCEAAGLRRELITPQRWQKEILGVIHIRKKKDKTESTKDALKRRNENREKIKLLSVQKANMRFGINLNNKQDGIADACNLALYAMKSFRGNLQYGN